MTFAEDLSLPLHTVRPPRFGKLPPQECELSLDRINLRIEFNDPLLETAYEDFRRFLTSCGIEISEDGIGFTLKRGATECFEAYVITVSENGVVISANDTEGMRRAVYFTEDEMMRREGARLPIGEICRRPFIKKRISRCYFSPASHAAIEEKENELCDEIDYYPDEYLSRLAHDGINTLWLSASLRHLVKSDIISEYGKDSERRMKKLNSVIEKCRRYGIETYLLSADPASDYQNPNLADRADMLGDELGGGIRHLCPSVEKTVTYINEAFRALFTAAPHLAGYINLSVGESQSHCASDTVFRCQRCKKKFGTAGRTLAFVEKTIADAIHSVSPNAEYISWTYAQRVWKDSDIKESCECRDTSVRHLVNFEDLGVEKQLGRERLAYDYWISYIGPGELFKKSIAYDKERGVKTYAKIQVCSSHEISTVPYVPVPGQLFEKYKYMHENSVEGVMQCWFFGNYPCLMNKAAGELSFEPFPKTREEFLVKLASIYWGSDGELVARAFEKFAEGYRNFPIGVNFEWYSPMQDSPCAPYHLEPVDLPMPSTWLLDDMVGSDRVCDALLDGHTLDEAILLCEWMCNSWNEGCDILSKIDLSDHPDAAEQVNVANAVGLIFRSGLNTMRFYAKRNDLALRHGDPWEILAQMREIVKEEIEISEKLIPITEKDNRIGYHSEAHGYKIFPEKLIWRIGEMKKLLKTEFPAVEDRISRGDAPLPFYYGEENGSVRYDITESEIEKAKWMDLIKVSESDGFARLKMAYTNDGYRLHIEVQGGMDYLRIDPEFKIFHRTSPILLKDGTIEINESPGYSLFGSRLIEKRELFKCTYSSEGDTLRYTVDFPRHGLEMGEGDPFRLMISIYKDGKRAFVLSPDDRVFSRLVVGRFSPDAFAFFIPKSDLY
jgi:hypothetical protein